jgi:hypothetical protein
MKDVVLERGVCDSHNRAVMTRALVKKFPDMEIRIGEKAWVEWIIVRYTKYQTW